MDPRDVRAGYPFKGNGTLAGLIRLPLPMDLDGPIERRLDVRADVVGAEVLVKLCLRHHLRGLPRRTAEDQRHMNRPSTPCACTIAAMTTTKAPVGPPI